MNRSSLRVSLLVSSLMATATMWHGTASAADWFP